MTTVMSSPARQQLSRALLGVTVVGGLISTVCVILQVIAGTALVTINGRQQVMLKEFAPVTVYHGQLPIQSRTFADIFQFNGIVPSDSDSSDLLVHLYWFYSYFAWEYPAATEGLPSASFTPTSYLTLDIMEDFHQIAAQLSLPPDSYDCPTPGRHGEPCSNAFFEACRLAFFFEPTHSMPILTSIVSISALVLCVSVLLQEVALIYKPYWMRCTCLFGRDWCPCPKGTREEIEALDDYAWDKVRLAYWGMATVWIALSSVGANLVSQLFMSTIRFIENRETSLKLDIRQGRLYGLASWGALGFSLLSFVCMLVKWKLSRRPKGWMEQQTLSDMHIEEEDTDASPADQANIYKDNATN